MADLTGGYKTSIGIQESRHPVHNNGDSQNHFVLEQCTLYLFYMEGNFKRLRH